MNLLLLPFSRLGAARSARQQRASALWDPSHWGATVNKAGNLAFDGVDLPGLVADCGSPLLAVSRTRLLSDARAFLDAVAAVLPDALVAYSYKTHCVPGVLQALHEAGLAAEVISPYELWLARELGVPGERIVVNGVNKRYDFIHDAVRAEVASINIDDRSELSHLRKAAAALKTKARVSLRLKVDRQSHFGLRLETGDAGYAAREIAAFPKLFEFTGLHFHALADNDDPKAHIACLTRALAFARQIEAEHGLRVGTLNIGGGYTVPTMKVMSRWEYARQRLLDVPARPPDPGTGTGFASYIREVATALENWCASNSFALPRVILEPGRIVTSQSHVLLTKVHGLKSNRRGPAFAMTDGGKILTSRPCDYEYHQMFVANRMGSPCSRRYHLMGGLCTDADWLARNRCLPRLQAGDVVAVMDAGAYFTSYASNFSFPRPAVVMLDAGEVRTLRRRETFEHLTAMDELHAAAPPGVTDLGARAAAE